MKCSKLKASGPRIRFPVDQMYSPVCYFQEEKTNSISYEHLRCPGIQISDGSEKAFTRKIDPREVCFLSANKFNSLKKWFTIKKEKEEERKKHEAYINYMRDLSKKLLAGNIRKLPEEPLDKEQKKERYEKKLVEDCAQIKRDRQKERQVIVEKYKKTNLINKTPTLELTRALRHSHILNERQKQIDLNKEIEMKEKEWDLKEHEEFKSQIEAAELQHLQKQEAIRSKQEELRSYLLRQCQEKEETKRKEYKEKIGQERTDVCRMAQELEELDLIKRKKNQEKKMKSLALQKQNLELIHKKRQFMKQREKELYKANEVINNVKMERDCHVKMQMKKEIERKIEQNLAIANTYNSQIPPVVPSEETIYQNALRKNQEEYEMRRNERNALLTRQGEDKIKDYKEGLKRQKEKEKEIAEMKKMEMVERYKNTEAMKNFNKITKQKEIERKRIYRQELMEQTAELKSLKEYENKMDDEFTLASYAKQDDHFFEYADEVLNFAKQKNWPLLPIQNAIKEYKKKQLTGFTHRGKMEIQKDQKDKYLDELKSKINHKN